MNLATQEGWQEEWQYQYEEGVLQQHDILQEHELLKEQEIQEILQEYE